MVTGTIYETKHYAVFSSFLPLPAIKLLGLISTVPKPRLQSILNVTEQVLHPVMKILGKHTKHIYIVIVMLSTKQTKSECMKESKTLQSCSAHYTKLISSPFLNSAIFIP